jgi:WD40 repeat protein
LLLYWREALSLAFDVFSPRKRRRMFMNSNTSIGGLPLGEAFSHHLRAFWNPVTARELYSSPDGTQLAVICGDGSVRVINAQTGSEHCRFIGSRRRIGPLIVDNPLSAKCAAWSPDGLRLAVGYEDGSIRIWDLAFQDEQLSWEWHTASVTLLAWSPDGQAIASVGDDVALGVWEAATGEERFIYQGPEPVKPSELGAYPYHCSWSPDSGRLAVACSDCTVRVLTAEIGEEEALLHCEGTAETLSWSPVGACVLVLVSNQGTAVWNPFENHFQPLIHLETPLQLAAWSSDGAYVALGSQEWVGMWRWEDLVEGRLHQGLAYYGRNIHGISWLPDYTLALAGAQGIVLASVGTQGDEIAMEQLPVL